MKVYLYFLLCVVICMPCVFARKESRMISAKDVVALSVKTPKAERKLFYGSNASQFAELRVPEGKGKHPLVIVIHGGCWTSKIANLSIMDPFCDALTQRGVATWNIEYRGFNNGGGWPGTFLDVGAAIDYVHVLAKEHNIDSSNVVVIGHSSGGHLALWAAGRSKIAKASALYMSNPLIVKGVVNLAGHGNLKEFELIQEAACMSKVLDELFKCASLTREDMYQDASPHLLLPLGVKQVVMAGVNDIAAPADFMKRYVEKAVAAGDMAEFIELEGGHFDLIMPSTSAFEKVVHHIKLRLN